MKKIAKDILSDKTPDALFLNGVPGVRLSEPDGGMKLSFSATLPC